MKKPLISIIIVNWNGKHHLEICLPSLEKQSYKNFEVILVDNGSDDGSVAWVKKHYPKTKILVNQKNLGFAEGNNQGFNISTGEYVLFLNNDTQVTKDFLVELVKELQSDEKIGGVQSKILFMDSPSQLDSVGSFFTNTGILYHYGVYAKDGPEFSKKIKVYSAKGACMMFKRQVLEKIQVDGEILDSEFFAYFEETDMCHRVWLAGFEIVYVPTSVIYHKFGATSKKLLKPFIEYHSYKNRINSYIKNLELINLIKLMAVHLPVCIGLSIVFLLKGRSDIFLAIVKALYWNLKNMIKTLRKRRFIQKQIRVVSDKRFLPRVTKSQQMGYYLSLLRSWNVTQTNVEKTN